MRTEQPTEIGNRLSSFWVPLLTPFPWKKTETYLVVLDVRLEVLDGILHIILLHKHPSLLSHGNWVHFLELGTPSGNAEQGVLDDLRNSVRRMAPAPDHGFSRTVPPNRATDTTRTRNFRRGGGFEHVKAVRRYAVVANESDGSLPSFRLPYVPPSPRHPNSEKLGNTHGATP